MAPHKFDAYPALHQVYHKILLGIAGGDVTISIVVAIMQHHMAGIRVKVAMTSDSAFESAMSFAMS